MGTDQQEITDEGVIEAAEEALAKGRPLVTCPDCGALMELVRDAVHHTPKRKKVGKRKVLASYQTVRKAIAYCGAWAVDISVQYYRCSKECGGVAASNSRGRVVGAIGDKKTRSARADTFAALIKLSEDMEVHYDYPLEKVRMMMGMGKREFKISRLSVEECVEVKNRLIRIGVVVSSLHAFLQRELSPAWSGSLMDRAVEVLFDSNTSSTFEGDLQWLYLWLKSLAPHDRKYTLGLVREVKCAPGLFTTEGIFG